MFRGNYRKNAVIAVGNGFPAWEKLNRVVAREQVEGAARDPLFRLVALPAQPDTFVVWDRLRLEGGDGRTLVFAEHPELKAAVEAACGTKFGHHPQDRHVPATALVTAAGEELVIDLNTLPAPLQKLLTLPRFLRADVSLDDHSPETAEVRGVPDCRQGRRRHSCRACRRSDSRQPASRKDRLIRASPRNCLDRLKSFAALFPPAVLFQPVIPRDAQGSLFLYHREDEPLRRLLLDEAERAELNRSVE